eukprot:COSAG06_NODE_7305_length_2551_cov_6.296085_2_plen_445_part_00
MLKKVLILGLVPTWMTLLLLVVVVPGPAPRRDGGGSGLWRALMLLFVSRLLAGRRKRPGGPGMMPRLVSRRRVSRARLEFAKMRILISHLRQAASSAGDLLPNQSPRPASRAGAIWDAGGKTLCQRLTRRRARARRRGREKMPQRGGRRGALRSASASVYPPPPSPLPGLDQSVGARSISGDDLTREEMQAPRVGQAGLAVLVLLTLAVLYGLEELSEAIAGRSDKPCESEVRRVLNPNWTVVLAFAVFAIGAAIFLWLWQVRLQRKRLHRTLCWHAQRQRMHLAVGLEPARDEPVRSRYQSADVRWRQEDTLLDKVDSADGARRAARPPAHLAISSHSRFPPSVTSMRRGARPAGCARARLPTALTHALAHALAHAHAQVEDEQHPRNEHYDDLPDDLLAVPRDSMEIQNVLECNNYSRDGEPIPVRALLQRAAAAAAAAAVW